MQPIETNTGRERLRLLRMIGDGPTARLEGEGFVEPGAGPPLHVHFWQDEGFRVVSGRLGYQLAGSEPKYLGPGEEAVFPAGVAHRFWNAGEDELRCTGWIRPPDNIEFFLGSIYDSQLRSGSRRPDPFEAAFLMWRYRSEFEMSEIPAFVRRFVLPIQVAVGRLLGKYRRYADAPRPVRADGIPRSSATPK